MRVPGYDSTDLRPFVNDADFTLYCGDVRTVLPTVESESVDCALTSPPFYALRDYGVDGQIGLEATPDEWVAELVQVFREVRRLLKPQATLWIEVGDSYAAQGAGVQGKNGQRADRRHTQETLGRRPPGIKPKDLLGAPWMLAFALRADGWYLRQCIVWHKPNAMPESVTDRCTTAHSYLFLLSKQPRYWFDAGAIAEPAAWERWGDQTVPKYNGTNTASGWIKPKTKSELRAMTNGSGSWDSGGLEHGKSTWPDGRKVGGPAEGAQKNARSVWSIPTQGYAEAHFATWPEALVERILKAGCPEWVCGTCGKPRERIVAKEPRIHKGDSGRTAAQGIVQRGKREDGKAIGTVMRERFEAGYEISESWSDCGHGNYRPGVALDPFMGSGTTALVARRLGRRSIGVELNRAYAEMAARRLGQQSLLAEGLG